MKKINWLGVMAVVDFDNDWIYMSGAIKWVVDVVVLGRSDDGCCLFG